MRSTHETTWRAGRFWWDCSQPTGESAHPLRAVLFDLDALTELERDGHRVVFNAAFAAHGLDFTWSEARYRELLALSDEHQRVTAELRKRCVNTECDVLTELLADDICTTKEMMFEEMILDAGLEPRAGLIDFVMDAYAQGMPLGVVTRGQRVWAEPLVRQLVGEGVVDTIVTAEDTVKPMPDPDGYRLALAEIGVSGSDALAIVGSVQGLRAAKAAGLAAVLIDPADTPRDVTAAVAVRADYLNGDAGADPLRVAGCQRLHARWWTAKRAGKTLAA